jgi:hypothetical protein
MKIPLIHCAVWTIAFVYCGTITAAEKVDVSKVIRKSDAEAVLGVPVNDAEGRNQKATDGFYDSEWSYYAVKGDKALVLDLLSPGRHAPPHLAQTMFSAFPLGGGKSTKINGIGDKAIFYHDKSGLEMMNILKGEVLLTIGIHGMPAKTALGQEKSIAKKILAKL